MWTRAELKDKAKITLKGVFWIAVVAILIYGLLAGGRKDNFSLNIINQGRNQVNTIRLPMGLTLRHNIYNKIIHYPLSFIITVIGSFGFLIALLWNFFIADPLGVGISRLFLQMKYEKEEFHIKTMFSVFKDNNYINIAKSIFMTNLTIFLWTLLFIIPGVIKGYQYYFVSWILAEYPDMDYKTAMTYSKDLTDGQKIDIVILELSFFGWFILGSIPFGLGIPLVATYKKATVNELYQVLKINKSPSPSFAN